MSLELRVSSDGHLESRQGFICFSWRSPFQRYVDSCHLVKIQVVLEGYLISHPTTTINKLTSSGKKFYSSELFCIRGVYGKRRLGEMFPQRSLVYPFKLHPDGRQRNNMIPSCTSDTMINVAYRLKSRIVLRDPGQQRTPDQAISSYTHQLDYVVPPCPVPNAATVDFIQRQKNNDFIPSSGGEGSWLFVAALSDPVARPSTQLEVLINMAEPPAAKADKETWRISAKLFQECCVEEGSAVVRKKTALFSIRLDGRSDSTEVISVPCCLPDSLLPTLIEKDQRAILSYHVQVDLYSGGRKKQESRATLPLIVLAL